MQRCSQCGTYFTSTSCIFDAKCECFAGKARSCKAGSQEEMQNSGEIPKAEAEEMRTRKKSEIFEADFALTCKVMGTHQHTVLAHILPLSMVMLLFVCVFCWNTAHVISKFGKCLAKVVSVHRLSTALRLGLCLDCMV